MQQRPDNNLWGFEAPREFQLRMSIELWGLEGTSAYPEVNRSGPLNHLAHDGEENTVSLYGHIHSTNVTYMVICTAGQRRAREAMGWMMAAATYRPTADNLYGIVQREAHELVGLGRSHLLAHLTMSTCQLLAAEAWQSAERGQPICVEQEPLSPDEVLLGTGMTVEEMGAFAQPAPIV